MYITKNNKIKRALAVLHAKALAFVSLIGALYKKGTGGIIYRHKHALRDKSLHALIDAVSRAIKSRIAVNVRIVIRRVTNVRPSAKQLLK